MSFRTMSAKCAGYTYYSSAFDQENGTISRVVDIPADMHTFEPEGVDQELWRKEWNSKVGIAANMYARRRRAYSPVPETVDIQVTNTCAMGCSYCYQSSTPPADHMQADVVDKIIDGFDTPPYQIAFGGGEPCEHPDFPSILRNTRAKNVVPNFTTAGYKIRQDVLDAAHDVCGGVALTFHPHYTAKAFAKMYEEWLEALQFRPNVHLVACAGVSGRLRELAKYLPCATVVLLAYYPVGRGTISGHMDKDEYMSKLPAAIRHVTKHQRMSISFSEGLFPYFNSRPLLVDGVEMSLPAEGRFSCYIDRNGFMTSSSFEPTDDRTANIHTVGSQAAWLSLHDDMPWLGGKACRKCPRRRACTSPHTLHKMLCAHQEHNKC